MVLTKKQVDIILSAVKEAGFDDAQYTGTDIEIAEYWIGEAEKAWKAGAKDEVIQTILNVSPNGIPVKNAVAAENFFSGGLFDIEEGLPIPKDIHEDPPELPLDYTTLSDEQLRRLHSSYNGYFARAKFLLSMAYNQLAAANHLKDDTYKRLYIEWNRKLEEEGQRVTKDLIDAFVKDDELYKMYEKDSRKQQDLVNSYKALSEIYNSNCDRLSREYTMRQIEYK